MRRVQGCDLNFVTERAMKHHLYSHHMKAVDVEELAM